MVFSAPITELEQEEIPTCRQTAEWITPERRDVSIGTRARSIARARHKREDEHDCQACSTYQRHNPGEHICPLMSKCPATGKECRTPCNDKQPFRGTEIE